MLTGQEVYSGGTPVLTRLLPDMVGEYFALEKLSKLNRTARHGWADLMVKRLGDCKEFFIRAIQDFGNDSKFVNVFIQLFTAMIKIISDCHPFWNFSTPITKATKKTRFSERSRMF